jgi:uncharacterized peroxidase-related enzyme
MNARIPALDPVNATGQTADLFGGVKAKLGVVPNLMRTLAQSPHVLQGYLGLGAALSQGVLPARVREQLALAISEVNGCDYCLSAHTLLGQKAGLTSDAVTAARRADAADPKVAALLQFARAVVAARGSVSDDALATVRAAGATDAELIEVVAHVAINVLTNYTNNLAQTVIDFPRAKPLTAAAAA